MGVDWGVSSGTGQILSISVRNVFAGLGISESLGETEIDDVDVVLLLANANQEVVRLDISMQEVSGMNELNPLQLFIIKLENKSTKD